MSGGNREIAAEWRETVIRDGTGILRIRCATQYRCARFHLEGTLDARTAPRLAAEFAIACLDPDVDVIAINLRQVTFLGAAGLTCLDATAKLGLHHNVRVSIWDALPFIRRTLAASDLDPSILMEPPES